MARLSHEIRLGKVRSAKAVLEAISSRPCCDKEVKEALMFLEQFLAENHIRWIDRRI